MCDESEFIERLTRASCKIWWIQDAVVEHIVRPEQVTKKWMWSRATMYGRGIYRQDVAFEGPPKLIAGLPRWAIRAWVERFGRVAVACIRRDEQDSFVARWYLNYYAGMLLEAARMRRTSR
jgi:hypothetical protein